VWDGRHGLAHLSTSVGSDSFGFGLATNYLACLAAALDSLVAVLVVNLEILEEAKIFGRHVALL